MAKIEETSKEINEDIGCWYFGYTILKTTEIEITTNNIFKVASWIEEKNKLNKHIIRKGQTIIIPRSEIDVALIIGIETSVTNREISKNINNNFSYLLLNESTRLYGTTHRPGMKDEKNLADDMIVGDKSESNFTQIVDKNGKKIDFSKILKYKNEPNKIIDIMKNKLNNFSMFDLEKVLNDWIDFFSQKFFLPNGEMSSFRIKEDSILTKKVKEHESTRDVINRIIDSLKNELTKDDIKGDIHQLLIEFEKNKNNNTFYKAMHWGPALQNDWTPNFSTKQDSLMGLRVLINDIWGYDIEIEKYQITGNTISGKLKIIFFDHFGLDDNDIKKFGNSLNGDGFKAWYFLQHYKGYTQIDSDGREYYAPFITQITVYEEFEFLYE